MLASIKERPSSQAGKKGSSQGPTSDKFPPTPPKSNIHPDIIDLALLLTSQLSTSTTSSTCISSHSNLRGHTCEKANTKFAGDSSPGKSRNNSALQNHTHSLPQCGGPLGWRIRFCLVPNGDVLSRLVSSRPPIFSPSQPLPPPPLRQHDNVTRHYSYDNNQT